MLRFLKRVNRRVVAVESLLAGSLVLTVFVVVLLQVVMRYLFERPNPWSEELSRFGFIWLSMLGAALAVELRTHFVFDQLVGRLRPKLQMLVRICSTAFIAAMAFGLVVLGLELVDLARSQRSPALNLRISWVYASVPVAGLLMLLHIAAALDTLLGREPEDQR
jgi:TRAP-type C4-dicarboxylate transport system permease small subunit